MDMTLNIGRMYSYWEGSTYTALYFYGSSFAEMKRESNLLLQLIMLLKELLSEI